MRRWQFVVALVLAATLSPGLAQAYCQATTGQAPQACPSSCVMAGQRLLWGTPEIEYAFHMAGFPGLNQTAVRAAIAAAFTAWEGTRCGDRLLGFRFSALDASTELTVGPLASEPNLNVISLLTPSEWSKLGFLPTEFARTKLWFDEQTGEIIGADIAFNGAIMPLAVCDDAQSCDVDTVDLQNVATHEIGHFLGLAHSDDESATMWCSAQRGDHQKRSLGADDFAGLCHAYGNGTAFRDPLAAQPEVDDVPGSAEGCALRPRGSPLAAWSSLLLALALASRRHRSRRGPQRCR